MSRRRYSVVIATYGRRALVSQCIESVLTQTRPPDEIVVVDDGSCDGTADAVRCAFPSVRVLEQDNRGRSVAMNRGVAAATGDWVCLLDDDDMWHRDKLQAVDDYLNENPDCVAVNHPVWWFRQEGISAVKAYGFSIDFAAESLDQCHAAVADGDPSQNDWSYLDIRGRSFEHLLERNRGALSASVLKREVYQAAGGLMPALTSADDWLLFLSVSRNAEWHTVPRRLAFCRQHGAQSTADVDNVRAILAAFNIAWHGGRPFPDKVDAADFARRLDDYRDEYRRMSQSFMRMAVRARRWDLIPIIRALSRPILAHRSDRMFALLPSRVTSRLWRND